MAAANRKHKDSVFTLLFSNPDLLRELYCALENVSLPQDVPVSINTLKNVLFMGKINDISFEIGGRLIVLIEHQSTVNPNMALRLLIYIAKLLIRSVNRKNLYSSKPLNIPWPEFYVLYNGIRPYPDKAVIRLSDLFDDPSVLGLPKKMRPALELEAKVFNINDGRNEDIAKKCKKLAEYSVFISKVRECYSENKNMKNAVRSAIIYCEKHDILKEFLETHAAEVLNMSLLEWTVEDALSLAREEGHEDGFDEGIEKGIEEGRSEEKLQIARNLLAAGSPPEFVQQITGLDPETFQSLQAGH